MKKNKIKNDKEVYGGRGIEVLDRIENGEIHKKRYARVLSIKDQLIFLLKLEPNKCFYRSLLATRKIHPLSSKQIRAITIDYKIKVFHKSNQLKMKKVQKQNTSINGTERRQKCLLK